MPTFTEPTKGTVTYTEPQMSESEATTKDLNEDTIKRIGELTMKEINDKYGKKTKFAKPTYNEPSKGTVTYTEPAKGD